jgi:hypothetical protein
MVGGAGGEWGTVLVRYGGIRFMVYGFFLLSFLWAVMGDCMGLHSIGMVTWVECVYE